MLYEAMMTPCRFMEKVRTSDGMGGWTTAWTEGEQFEAAFLKDNSTQAELAEKQGVTETYTITVFRQVPLDFHDVVKRLSDGATFRVTSNKKDNESPTFSAIDFGQVKAERWTLE